MPSAPGLAILALKKVKKREEEDNEESPGMAFEDAAREAFQAAKEDDFGAFVGALGSAIDIKMAQG